MSVLLSFLHNLDDILPIARYTRTCTRFFQKVQSLTKKEEPSLNIFVVLLHYHFLLN